MKPRYFRVALLLVTTFSIAFAGCKKKEVDLSEWKTRLLSSEDAVRTAAVEEFKKAPLADSEKGVLAEMFVLAAQSDDPKRRYHAFEGLLLTLGSAPKLVQDRISSLYLESFMDPNPAIRYLSAQGAGMLKMVSGGSFLEQLTADPEPLIRQQAVKALAEIGGPSAQEVLAYVANRDADPDTAKVAMDILVEKKWPTQYVVRAITSDWDIKRQRKAASDKRALASNAMVYQNGVLVPNVPKPQVVYTPSRKSSLADLYNPPPPSMFGDGASAFGYTPSAFGNTPSAFGNTPSAFDKTARPAVGVPANLASSYGKPAAVEVPVSREMSPALAAAVAKLDASEAADRATKKLTEYRQREAVFFRTCQGSPGGCSTEKLQTECVADKNGKQVCGPQFPTVAASRATGGGAPALNAAYAAYQAKVNRAADPRTYDPEVAAAKSRDAEYAARKSAWFAKCLRLPKPVCTFEMKARFACPDPCDPKQFPQECFTENGKQVCRPSFPASNLVQ